jgi:adhesin transport system outer membrane protein
MQTITLEGDALFPFGKTDVGSIPSKGRRMLDHLIDRINTEFGTGVQQAQVGDKVVDGYRQQFRLGRRQLLDLLNIQAEAFGYQSSATTAFYDEQVARARLLAATGDLAKRF